MGLNEETDLMNMKITVFWVWRRMISNIGTSTNVSKELPVSVLNLQTNAGGV